MSAGESQSAVPKGAKSGLLMKLRILLSLGLLAVIGILVSQPGSRDQLVNAFASISFLDVIFVAVLFALMRTVQAGSLSGFLFLHHQRIGFKASLTLAGLKGLFNLAFLGLGLAAQSAQGKLTFRVPVRVMVFVNISQSFMLILALGLSLGTASALLTAGTNFPEPALFMALGAGFALFGVAGTIACLFPRQLPRRLRECGFFRWLRFLDGGEEPRGFKVYWLGILQLVLILLRTVRLLFIAYVIAPDVDLELLAITVLAADLLSAIPITPGGIGVRELVIGSFGSAAGYFEVFLAAAIIDRILTVVLNLVHGTIAVMTSGRADNAVE